MNNLLLKLLICSIYLINIQLFMLGAVALKPIHIFGFVFFIISNIQRPSIKNIVKFFIVLLVVFLGYFNAIDKTEFWKSFILIFLGLGLLLFAPNLISNFKVERKIRFFYFVFKSYVVIVLYGVIQFFAKNFLGSDFLYNNLGQFQFHPHYENDLFGFSRATSIFYEPSVFAWVTNLIISILLIYQKKIGFSRKIFLVYLFIYLLGLLVSLSSSGLLSLIVITLVYYVSVYGIRLKKIVLFGPIFFGIVLLALPYLRLSEIVTENTSGFNRVVFPFLNLLEVLKNYPFFGRALGQFGVEDNKLLYDGVIHNSVYGLFISFGLSSLVLIAFAFHRFYTHLKSDLIWAVLWLNLLFIFSSTGSFLSLELPFIYLIIFTLYNLVNSVSIRRQLIQ